MSAGPSNDHVVSVMMPAYNAGQYIEDAIRSVQNQTFTNWQLVCYDDGSTDNTREVVARMAADDPRVLLVCGQHGGRGRARNAALAYCNGEFVAMCDADDMSLPTRFEKQVDYLRAHPEITAVGGLQIPFTDKLPSGSWKLNLWPLSPSDIASRFNGLRMAVPNCVALVRRSAFVGNGFDEVLLRAQDFGFFLRLHLAGARFATLDEGLVFYRQDGLIPGLKYWLEAERYHCLAIERAGELGPKITLSGRLRYLLRGRLMLSRYTLFRLRKVIELRAVR